MCKKTKKELTDIILTLTDYTEDNPEAEEARAYFNANQTYAMLDDAALPIRIYDRNDIEYSDMYAYANGGFFYLYKGSCLPSIDKGPGIYLNPETKEYYMREVNMDDSTEVAKYKICADHLVSLDKHQILEDLKKNSEDIYANQDRVTQSYIPKVEMDDDCLKRLIKMALLAKGVDLDQCKMCFSDKNALFNFKQVLKTPDSRMTIKIFERGVDALNLAYDITIREANPDGTVGKALSGPITVSSDDTYEL